MNLTTLHLTNILLQIFFFILTRLHIKNCVFQIWLLFMTLQYYTLLWNYFYFFSVLQNYTLLQTVCFRSKYFVCTLQCYTLQTVFFRFSFLTLQYYILLYNIFEEKKLSNYFISDFFFTLQPYSLQIITMLQCYTQFQPKLTLQQFVSSCNVIVRSL